MELKIKSQTSLAIERYSDNGNQKSLHYVVKNTNFEVEVELINKKNKLNFNDIMLEASLFYDIPESKEVKKLKVKPFEYKGIVKASNPNVLQYQISISVLSSQHEFMNFFIKFDAKDILTNDYIKDMSVRTEAIQVISKPDVLRKKNTTRKRKKRTWNQTITETLERMEKQQQDHHEWLKNMLQNGASSELFTTETKFTLDQPSSFSNNDCINNKTPSEKFEDAFYNFINCYKELEANHRPTKIRKIVQESTPENKEIFCSIVKDFQENGLPQNNNNNNNDHQEKPLTTLGKQLEHPTSLDSSDIQFVFDPFSQNPQNFFPENDQFFRQQNQQTTSDDIYSFPLDVPDQKEIDDLLIDFLKN